jgi:hypothetical protein
VFSNDFFKEPLLNDWIAFLSLIFAPTDNICSHELTNSPFVHLNPTIQNHNSKIKTPRVINSLSFVFIYKTNGSLHCTNQGPENHFPNESLHCTNQGLEDHFPNESIHCTNQGPEDRIPRNDKHNII